MSQQVSNEALENADYEEVYQLLGSNVPELSVKRRLRGEKTLYIEILSSDLTISHYFTTTTEKPVSKEDLRKTDEILMSIIGIISNAIKNKAKGLTAISELIIYLSDKIEEISTVINMPVEAKISMAKNLIDQVLNIVKFDVRIKGFPIPWTLIKAIIRPMIMDILERIFTRKQKKIND